MALPLLGDAKVDKILSQFSQKYTNDNYISELILPVMKVKEKTGNYATYGTENLRTYTDQIWRAPGTRAKQIDYTVSQGEYSCREVSVEKRVPDEYLNNTDDPYDPKRDAIATCMDVIWANQERALASYLTDTGNLTNNTTLSGTSQWSDYNNSTPIADIETGINTIRAATGKRPNTLVMSHAVYTKLKYHPEFLEQIKYTNGVFSDADLGAFLKGFFNLENIYIGSAVYNSTDEGQTASITDIWNKDAYLIHKTARPTLMGATFGYTFMDVPRKVDIYREEQYISDVVRCRYSYDQNVMDVNLAYLIKNAIA